MGLAVRQVVFTDVQLQSGGTSKKSLRPQFSFEKADMVEGLSSVQVKI
jgi:hypothetical protein